MGTVPFWAILLKPAPGLGLRAIAQKGTVPNWAKLLHKKQIKFRGKNDRINRITGGQRDGKHGEGI